METERLSRTAHARGRWAETIHIAWTTVVNEGQPLEGALLCDVEGRKTSLRVRSAH